MNGDGTIIAHLASTQNFISIAKAGLMIRETLTAESRNVMMTLHAFVGWAFEARTTSGITDLQTYGPYPPVQPWLKLPRSGNTFTVYQSSDGVTWNLMGTISSAGLYAAPSAINAQHNVIVTATNKTDASESGTAFVTLQTPISPGSWHSAAAHGPTGYCRPSSFGVVHGATELFRSWWMPFKRFG